MKTAFVVLAFMIGQSAMAVDIITSVSAKLTGKTEFVVGIPQESESVLYVEATDGQLTLSCVSGVDGMYLGVRDRITTFKEGFPIKVMEGKCNDATLLNFALKIRTAGPNSDISFSRSNDGHLHDTYQIILKQAN